MSDDNGSDDKNPNSEKPNSPPKPSSPWGKPQDTSNNGNEPVKGPWGQYPNNRPNNSQNNPNNPWGNGGNGQQSQNLDDLAKRVEDKIRGMFGNGAGGGGNNPPPSYSSGGNVDGRVFGYIGIGIFALWLASGIYKVDAGEQAIVTRFGQYVRIAGDGLNYRLPSPIERHTIVNVQKVNTLTVGADGDENSTNGLMLTGDENIVNVGFQVFWRVNNAPDFVFNVAHGPDNNGNADQTINAVAEAAMREVVGRSQLEKVLTTGRSQVEQQTKELIQKTLDQYQSGIVITQVNLRRSEPPSSVVDAFRQVAAASQEAETKVNQATTYRNSVVPQAQGEAARFNQLYQEYKLAPDVTRQRIYLETMEKIYERANKIIIDEKAGNGTMMVLPQDLLKPAAPKDAQNANNGGNK